MALDAVFYEAQLVGTVFVDADLRGATFFRADLSRARFAGARLAGARFGESRDVPAQVAAHLDPDGLFIGPDEPLSGLDPNARLNPQVFVSRPSVLTPSQEYVWRLIEDTLKAAGATVVQLVRSEYPPVGVLADVRRAMADCRGVVVLGLSQLVVSTGSWRPGTPDETPADGLSLSTPWNQLEAGVAAALGLPVFIVREPGVVGGVFDLVGDAVTVVEDVQDALGQNAARSALDRWVRDVALG